MNTYYSKNYNYRTFSWQGKSQESNSIAFIPKYKNRMFDKSIIYKTIYIK